jgi:hypothetical protein
MGCGQFRQVRYVTVAGNAVRGVAESDAERKARKQQKVKLFPPQYAFGSYQQVRDRHRGCNNTTCELSVGRKPHGAHAIRCMAPFSRYPL